ncbi:helix-turn-helix transcriptional regulator [Amycolatopsis thailandensis]|uniref:helix-turn-helix transcriptional regulator n=1 Tax=Amycolatopsis thailandensis TaxID=589330 RepID=UPI00365FBFA3
MQARKELSDFLRSRRDRLRPEDVGLTSVGRRRTPGLRRTEIAHLAGISVDYYVRMEQGRDGRPSPTVLEALSRVLGLDEDERSHLYTLARSEPAPRRANSDEEVRPSVRRLLELLNPSTPAFVVGRRMEVLAWNDLAVALLTDFEACRPPLRNMVWHGFCDPAARELYVDWEQMARQELAHLRVAVGRYPDDPGIVALVGELFLKSEDFRQWWENHDVQDRSHGLREFDHPLVGKLELHYESLSVPGVLDQKLVTYTADKGSPSQAALEALAAAAAETKRAHAEREAGPENRVAAPGG